MKNLLVLIASAFTLSLVSYGIYSFFGFTDYSLVKRLGFLGLVFAQIFTPMLVIFLIYSRAVKDETKFYDKAKAEAGLVDMLKK